jgi:hypothetical protein
VVEQSPVGLLALDPAHRLFVHERVEDGGHAVAERAGKVWRPRDMCVCVNQSRQQRQLARTRDHHHIRSWRQRVESDRPNMCDLMALDQHIDHAEIRDPVGHMRVVEDQPGTPELRGIQRRRRRCRVTRERDHEGRQNERRRSHR